MDTDPRSVIGISVNEQLLSYRLQSKAEQIASTLKDSCLIPPDINERSNSSEFAKALSQAIYYVELFRNTVAYSDLNLYLRDIIQREESTGLKIAESGKKSSTIFTCSSVLLGGYWARYFVDECRVRLDDSQFQNLKNVLDSNRSEINFDYFCSILSDWDMLDTFYRYMELDYFDRYIKSQIADAEEVVSLAVLYYYCVDFFEKSSPAWVIPLPMAELTTRWDIFLPLNEIFGNMCLDVTLANYTIKAHKLIKSAEFKKTKIDNPLLIIMVYSYATDLALQLQELNPQQNIMQKDILDLDINNTDFNALEGINSVEKLKGYRGLYRPPPELIAHNLMVKTLEELSYFYNGHIPSLYLLAERIHRQSELLIFPKSSGVVIYQWIKLFNFDIEKSWFLQFDELKREMDIVYLPGITDCINKFFKLISKKSWGVFRRDLSALGTYGDFEYQLSQTVPVVTANTRFKQFLRTLQKANGLRKADRGGIRTIPSIKEIQGMSEDGESFEEVSVRTKGKYIFDLITASLILNIDNLGFKGKSGTAIWINAMLEYLNNAEIAKGVTVRVVLLDAARLKDIYQFIQCELLIIDENHEKVIPIELRITPSRNVKNELTTSHERENPHDQFMAHVILLKQLVARSKLTEGQKKVDVVRLSWNNQDPGTVFYSSNGTSPTLLSIISSGTLETAGSKKSGYLDPLLKKILDTNPPTSYLQQEPLDDFGRNGAFLRVDLEYAADSQNRWRYEREQIARVKISNSLPEQYPGIYFVNFQHIANFVRILEVSDIIRAASNVPVMGRMAIMNYLISTRSTIDIYIALLYASGVIQDDELAHLMRENVLDTSVSPTLYEYWRKISLEKESPMFYWVSGGDIKDLEENSRLRWIIKRFTADRK